MNLLNAAKQGNTKKVKKLLMAGVPCDWRAPDGSTPLIMAALHGHHSVVELLLAKGSCVNQATVVECAVRRPTLLVEEACNSAVYRTPLISAVEGGYLKVVELLLTKGADIHQAQEEGATPLHIAAQHGRLAIAELLVSKGADVNLAARHGSTTLHIVAQNGHFAIAELLVSHGADINLSENDGASPLHIATQNGHLAVVELLVSRGANTSLSYNGLTPAEIAAHFGHQKIFELLLLSGASLGSSVSATGPPTPHARTLAEDDHRDDKIVAKERGAVGGTEELRRVDELSRQVQGLRASGRARGRSSCVRDGSREAEEVPVPRRLILLCRVPAASMAQPQESLPV